MSRVTDLNFDGLGRLRLHIEGHPTDVIEHAREIARLVLGDKGAWRITNIIGKIPAEAYYDSEMKFKIIAEVKD